MPDEKLCSVHKHAAWHLFAPDEDQLEIGVAGERVHGAGNGHRRAVIPAHHVESDTVTHRNDTPHSLVSHARAAMRQRHIALSRGTPPQSRLADLAQRNTAQWNTAQ